MAFKAKMITTLEQDDVWKPCGPWHCSLWSLMEHVKIMVLYYYLNLEMQKYSNDETTSWHGNSRTSLWQVLIN